MIAREREGLEERLNAGLERMVDQYQSMMRSYDTEFRLTEEQRQEFRDQIVAAMRASC